MALGSLVVHMHMQHGMAAEWIRSWENTAPGEEPRTYRIEFMTAGGHRNCPVEGCLGGAATRTAMRVHFSHRHVRDTVAIFGGGNPPSHPHFPHCDMLVPCRALNRRHLVTYQCARGVERKRMRLAEEELRESSERDF